MEPIPYALTGYLDAGIPGNDYGTAAWRLTSSPDGCTDVQEAIIPCTTSRPDLAHALLTECQTGDLLRVTGYLTLPDTADGYIRLDVDTLEVLWAVALELDQFQEEENEAEEDGAAEVAGGAETEDRPAWARAIHVLAEALTGLACDPAAGEQPDIGIRIGPVDGNELDSAYCHRIDVTTATAHKLADAIDAMLAVFSSLLPQAGTALDPLALADLTAYFGALDLIELTRDVLNATRPEDKVAVTRALDDLLGDIPVTGFDDSDQ
ncbi:hypothetical protein AB0E08_48825 [Streptomyces sp. NPDC048281]|uniref:hypothetical protein n=1 Tax=Streptomyces sp. NPDC048281 TaxID=3154715 RepID=UPI0034379841